jgi:hypothetical protein
VPEQVAEVVVVAEAVEQELVALVVLQPGGRNYHYVHLHSSRLWVRVSVVVP